LYALLEGIHRPTGDDGEKSPGDDPLSRLNGRLVIHTLTEGAGHRVRLILQQRSPECQVELNSDKTGTCQLKELARSADLFVMVTASAKHAATGFIEMHRPAGRPLLRPA